MGSVVQGFLLDENVDGPIFGRRDIKHDHVCYRVPVFKRNWVGSVRVGSVGNSNMLHGPQRSVLPAATDQLRIPNSDVGERGRPTATLLRATTTGHHQSSCNDHQQRTNRGWAYLDYVRIREAPATKKRCNRVSPLLNSIKNQ